MLQEEFGSTQSVLSEPVLTPDCSAIPDRLEGDEPHLVARLMAEHLIEKCCGSHSLGLVYRFLRKTGMDEGQARAEFELFLSGVLSETLLDRCTHWIQAERT